jgi:hypothetical protein
MPLIDPVTMSASMAKGSVSQAAAKEKDDSPALQPIQVRETPLAQAARHGFPALLAALFLYQFHTLVADPVSTMWTALPVVALLQCGYAVVCLPVAGSQSAKPAKKPRPGEKKKPADGAGPNAVVVRPLSRLIHLPCYPR